MSLKIISSDILVCVSKLTLLVWGVFILSALIMLVYVKIPWVKDKIDSVLGYDVWGNYWAEVVVKSGTVSIYITAVLIVMWFIVRY